MIVFFILTSFVVGAGVGTLISWGIISSRINNSAQMQKAIEKARREGIAEGYLDGRNHRPGLTPPEA